MGRSIMPTGSLVRKMTHRQRVAYAIFAAEQVVGTYEASYPGDRSPRNAIEAAKKCLLKPTRGNRAAANAAEAYASFYARVLRYGLSLIYEEKREEGR